MTAITSVKDVRLSTRQDALLLSLERRMQLRAQAASRAQLLRGAADAAATLRGFRAAHRPSRTSPTSTTSSSEDVAVLGRFSARVEASAGDGAQLLAGARQAAALVEDMEASHAQVAAKTRALYDSFETVLQQVEALTARVDAVAAPLPHFTAIARAAQTLGFGVKFAAASAGVTGGGGGGSTASHQPPVQVFQHRRSIDPTTKAFEDALEQIDASVAYLEQHVRWRRHVQIDRRMCASLIVLLMRVVVNSPSTETRRATSTRTERSRPAASSASRSTR